MSAAAVSAAMPPAPPPPRPRPLRATLLAWTFTAFNAARVFAYLPQLWAIHASADSSQHSLWTWLTLFGANLSMAAWLRERDGGRLERATLVSLVNAAMCLATAAMIGWYRLP